MRHAAALAWAALFIAVGVSSASGADCANKIKVEQGAIQKVIECLVELQKENAELKQQVADLQKDALPEHTVIIMDDPKGCPPPHWTDLGTDDAERFAGRTIVAVGRGVDRENDLTTRRREYGDQGGSESHALTAAEIPPLSFAFELKEVTFSEVDKYNAGGSDYPAVGSAPRTVSGATQSSGDAFATMPPFIALFFCRKDKF